MARGPRLGVPMSACSATGSSRSATSAVGRRRRGRTVLDASGPRRRARVHRPARPLRWLAVRRRRARQPPAPGVHDPAVGELRRHARADHRSGRELVALVAAAERPDRPLATFAEYLDAVEREALGPNVAFLVGHGTVRGAVLGADARTADDLPSCAAMVREVEAAMDAGAFGLSSGLIYAPGMHAGPGRGRRRWSRAATRHGGLYATHMRNEAAGLFESLDEAIGHGPRGRRRRPAPGLAPQVRRPARSGAERPRPSTSWSGPRGRPGRRRRPVPVHGRRDDPRDDPPAGPARPRRRGLRRGARRPRGPRPRPRRDGARDLGLGERRGRPGLGRDP